MASTAPPQPHDGVTHIKVSTSIGKFVIELYYQHAPLTCQNITLLALAKFYDNHPIHRVISNFMFQMGDPTGTGRGGQSAWGTPFRDEITRELKHVGAGVVSMANAGPNTNKSQFFVTLAPSPHLDGKHNVFGRISEGMSVVERIGMVPTDKTKGDRPKQEVTVYSVRAMRGGIVDGEEED